MTLLCAFGLLLTTYFLKVRAKDTSQIGAAMLKISVIFSIFVLGLGQTAFGSLFGCGGDVYDSKQERIRTFTMFFGLVSPQTEDERALVTFDGATGSSRPYGMATCRGNATGGVKCEVESTDAQSDLPDRLTFYRDSKGALAFSSETGLTAVRAAPCPQPKFTRFEILDVSYHGTVANPAKHAVELTIRPKFKDKILSCGVRIKGFHQGESLFYQDQFDSTCDVSQGPSSDTITLWISHNKKSEKPNRGTYYMEYVSLTTPSTHPEVEFARGLKGFVVP